MDPWTGVSLALVLIILIFTSLILGLIRHNVLQDPDSCCLPESPCKLVLLQQISAYYAPFIGLRTRYIFATVMFIFITFLRLSPITLPAVFQNPTLLAFFALLTYTLQLLFADLTLHNLADTPIGLVEPCSLTSAMLVGAINVLAWFSLILSSLLFFIFMTSQNAVHHYIPVLRFTKNGPDDEEEVVIVGQNSQ